MAGLMMVAACERPAAIDPSGQVGSGPMPVYAPPPPPALKPFEDPVQLDAPFYTAYPRLNSWDNESRDQRWAREQVYKWRFEKGGLESRDRQGNTRLMRACWSFNLHHIRLLTQARVDLQARNHRGQTALHLAAQVRREAIIDLLVMEGADPNAPDDRGWTPLHVAAHRGWGPVVKRLVIHGADPNVRAESGLRPVDLARQRGHTHLLKTLSKGLGVNPLTEEVLASVGSSASSSGVLTDLLMLGGLLGLGLLAAWLRWGRLGLLAFVGLVHSEGAPESPRRSRLLVSRPMRLLALALAFFLIGWAGVLARADLQTLGAFISGGTP